MLKLDERVTVNGCDVATSRVTDHDIRATYLADIEEPKRLQSIFEEATWVRVYGNSLETMGDVVKRVTAALTEEDASP